jgi:hypothetical protein
MIKLIWSRKKKEKRELNWPWIRQRHRASCGLKIATKPIFYNEPMYSLKNIDFDGFTKKGIIYYICKI